MTRLTPDTLADALAKSRWQPGEDSRRVGYARVSTGEQNLDMQIAALERNGVLTDDLFSEQLSAVAQRRPRLAAALRHCRRGDVLIVWRLDRLARSLTELLRIMQELDERGIGFQSLTERVDTTVAIGRLYVHIAGAFAEFERQLIVERTKAGVARAKERGVRFGRERQIDLAKAEKLIRSGKTIAQVALACGVSRPTVYNWFGGAKLAALRRSGPKRK